MRGVLLSGGIVLAFLASVSMGAVRRVPSEYPSIQRAIADSNDGDTVLVSPGVYYETINFSGKNITVTGTDPNDPKVVGYTIINADGDGTAVTFENRETARAVLTGFTITGGVGTLTSSSTNYKYFRGAGIYCVNASPTITRNVITNNHGPYTDEQRGNTWYYEYSYGGGIYASGAVTLTNNVIYNNSAFYGGGVYVIQGTIADNIIYDNSAGYGGGVYMSNGRLTNNTVVGNDCAKYPEYGRGGNVYAYFGYYENLLVASNIICGAKSGNGLYYGIRPRSALICCNNVWDNAPANYLGVDPRTGEYLTAEQSDWTGQAGNISADPLFMDTWSKNYHLQPTSPCVSAGDPNYEALPGERDIDGEPRVFALRVDMGADEHIGYVKPIAHAGQDQHVLAPEPVTLDAGHSYFSDPEGVKTYHWTQTEGPAVDISDAASGSPGFTPPAEGWYVFELVVGDGQYDSKPDQVLVVVGNERPVAHAGRDQLWRMPGFITLDGSKSRDADPPDELAYTWTQISGPNVVLEAPDSMMPRFRCSEAGIYVFELTVGDGFVDSEPDRVKLEASAWTLSAQAAPLATPPDQQYSFYPDPAGTHVVYAGGAQWDERFWQIHCLDRQSGRVDTFDGGAVDIMPVTDGGRIVWAGGGSSSTYGPICTSIYLADLATGNMAALRIGTSTESYGYPAMSGNKVVWAHHRNVNTREIEGYIDAPYDIEGADITDPAHPVFFTIATNVGRGEPYPYWYADPSNSHDDPAAIGGDLVVWEDNGDLYGADLSDLDHIRVFPVCTAPERQYDPSISGRLVVWTDQRNDIADIYGADISDPNNIREFEVAVDPGPQVNPRVDGPMIVCQDGGTTWGMLRTCCLSREYGIVDFPLIVPSGYYFFYGSGVEIDGTTITWTYYDDRIHVATYDFAYSVTEGPIQNLTTGKRYDYIQHAVDAADDGDIIVVEPGTYGDKVRFKGKKVIVTSSDPEDPAVCAATILKGPGQCVAFTDDETDESVLTGFTLSGSGYGILCGASSPAISYCTMADNTHAGIKLWNEATPTFTRCEILGNGRGAEMWAQAEKRVILRSSGTFRNCLIAGNRQAGLFGGNLTMENCTVADNLGPGIDCYLANVTNSIIYFNNQAQGGNVDVSNTKSQITYSDVQGGWPGQGNMDADPLFVRQGRWLEAAPVAAVPVTGRRTGGAKATPGPAGVWTTGDYHLQSQGWSWDVQQRAWTWDDATSPCIDAGDPAAPIGEEQPCEAGGPFSERAGANTRLNMGAYGGTPEASLAPR